MADVARGVVRRVTKLAIACVAKLKPARAAAECGIVAKRLVRSGTAQNAKAVVRARQFARQDY
jgi:hypothetical protein